jgi:peptidylprolyl isomerase
VLSPGDGRTVEAGDFLAVNVLSQVWAGDELESSYDRGESVTFPVGSGQVITGWDAGLVGQKVGSRVMLSVPPDLAYGEEGYSDARIPGSVTLVFVFDILGAYAADVGGDADATPTAEAMSVVPLVRGELGSITSLSVPEGASEPTVLSTVVLAEGSGQPVVAGEVVVQYTWATWDNARGQSTWVAGAPAVLQVGAGGPFDGLAGVPMGSRALVQVPADENSPAVAMVVDLVDQLTASG